MLQAKRRGKKPIILAVIGACIFLATNLQVANGKESGCITCHLDKEMLIKTAKVEEGKKSALQSGAG